MNIHEYQAKDLYRAVRHSDRQGLSGLLGRRGRRSGEEAAGPGLGGEIADPRRRPRQGQVQGSRGGHRRRRAPRQIHRRGQGVRRPDARQHARHAADRPRGQQGPAPLRRGWLGHRARTLSLHAGRPRDQPRLVHRLDRRRHGHREGGPRHAGEDLHHLDRSGVGLFPLPRPQDRVRARPHRRPGQPVRQAGRQPLPDVRREGHGLLEINPLVVTKDGNCSPSTAR